MIREGNKVTYWSLDEYADAMEKQGIAKGTGSEDPAFAGATWDESLNMARKGWTRQLKVALEIAESAVTMAEREHMVDSFNQPVWDVTGAQVDVGAYLAGTPECMVDYPLSETSKAGRVIALCASISYSSAVGSESIKLRGRTMVALAMALSRLGHNTELWADLSGGHGDREFRIRVLVKGANDELDPARVMFAYAHPAMLRQLHFAALEGRGWPSNQLVMPPKRDLPEGTIYLPELVSAHDMPEADEFLRAHLGELGLLAE